MSNFYIYSADRERIGLLQHYDAVQWLEHYGDTGEVKIDAYITPDNLTMLVVGNRIHNPDTDTVAVIVHRDLTKTDGQQTITVYGHITAKLLDLRVVQKVQKITNVELGMYALYRNNRGTLPIEIGEPRGYPQEFATQITWNSVLDGVLKLSAQSGLGFKVLFDPQTGVETFVVYRGIDRSREHLDAYIGYFGTDVEGIQNVTVTSGVTDYKNVAVVAGAGEGENRTVVMAELTDNLGGENRRELYVDARDLQPHENETTASASYKARLRARGLEKLAEQTKTFSITCEIVQNNIFYGKDYCLGDRMPIKLPEYGIYASARIESVTMIYEKEGNKIVAILSDFLLHEQYEEGYQ